MLARVANCFLYRPGKQEKTSVNSVVLPYLVVIGRTVKKLNLYFRKPLNEKKLLADFHI